MTKAEFLDVLARDSRIGNKKEAGQAVDAVLDVVDARARGAPAERRYRRIPGIILDVACFI